MKRSAFIQSRTKKCKVCREPFAPRNMQHKVCSSGCGLALAAKDRLTRDRKELLAYRERTKRKADHVADAQKAFNACRREVGKAAGHACISCAAPLDWSGNGVDAGHYRSVGSAPHMRFVENNVWAQCKRCNNYLSGNAVEYRKGLIARIGLEAVEAIEADNNPRHYSVDDLKAIRAEYKQKLKQLQGGVTVDCNQPSPEQNQLGSRECVSTV